MYGVWSIHYTPDPKTLNTKYYFTLYLILHYTYCILIVFQPYFKYNQNFNYDNFNNSKHNNGCNHETIPSWNIDVTLKMANKPGRNMMHI